MPDEELEELILNISEKSKIRVDILEKDYYVCLVLKELSLKQDSLKAYFKGGTALYKILNQMNRFSEDIDLTVKVLKNESKTSNINRLKKSAFDYNIKGLSLLKEEIIDRKGSIIAYYEYQSLFKLNDLFKMGKIQIETASFTVSEPIKTYNIEALIYKLADEKEKMILKNDYNISSFKIKIIKLERIFIDKIFAIEFYFIRKKYDDVSKHLYDIVILSKEIEIKRLLKNKVELENIINYKREEELVRKGGISNTLKIKDFSYFNLDFDLDLQSTFKKMQDIYVLSLEYKIKFDFVLETLNKLKSIFEYYDI